VDGLVHPCASYSFNISSFEKGGMSMSNEDIKQLREALLRKRAEIFERLRRFEKDWQELGERESELEEEAQKSDIASLFDKLDERAKNEIEEIDLALCRLAVGRYGICESCEKLIPLERLESLPAARLCYNCASKYERLQKKLRPVREMIPCAELPDEYQNLSDEELQLLILEHLRNDSRIDLQELDVSCRKGVVYLEGAVPSEAEHQILLQTLTDVMGFAAVVDLLRADEVLWEREDRSPGKSISIQAALEGIVYEGDKISEDAFESEEKGNGHTSPDLPQPESE